MTAVIDTPTALCTTLRVTDLREALTFVAMALPTRPVVPVLAGVRLSSHLGLLTMAGFDYDVAASTSVPAHGEGVALVNHADLLKCAKALDGDQVTLTVTGDVLVVTDGETTFRLDLLPLEDYPALPTKPDTRVAALSGADLTAMARVTVAAGRDDTLPVLMCVALQAHEGTLEAAASDRYRLAVQQLPHVPAETEVPLLIGARTFAAVAKQLGGEVHVTIDVTYTSRPSGRKGVAATVIPERVRFTAGVRHVDVHCSEGDFPKYRSLWPSAFTGSITFGSKPVQTTVTRIASAPGITKTSPIRFEVSNGEVALAIYGDGKQRGRRTIAATVDTDDITVAYQPRFLLDGLKMLGNELVRLDWTTPTRPGVLVNPDEPTLRYLLMPVRFTQ